MWGHSPPCSKHLWETLEVERRHAWLEYLPMLLVVSWNFVHKCILSRECSQKKAVKHDSAKIHNISLQEVMIQVKLNPDHVTARLVKKDERKKKHCFLSAW